jgi:ADP-ribose pyrophosphatase YjhB (NUDIX family)
MAVRATAGTKFRGWRLAANPYCMNYCSHCGSSELVFDIPSGDNRSRWICQNCETIHYSNPKIVTGCLPIFKDQVLLAKRAIEPRLGFWNIPSGYMENGETVQEGATREVQEETEGLVRQLELFSVFSIPRINQVYMHFLGELVDGAFGIGPESSEVQLFSETEIPWKEIAFTSSVFTLRHFFADRKKGKFNVHVGHMEESRLRFGY